MTSHSTPSDGPSALATFVRSLGTDRDVVVTLFEGDEVTFDASCMEVLEELDAAQRADLGDHVPPLNPAAAKWAACQLYRACQFLVCREVPGEVVTEILARPCPGLRDVSTDYSVDIFFRFLPDVLAIARRMAPADPLTGALMAWAKTWPLSSVGAPVGTDVTSQTFAQNPALMRLYSDRVVERQANDRLCDPHLRALLRADAGLFPNLIPFPSSSYTND